MKRTVVGIGVTVLLTVLLLVATASVAGAAIRIDSTRFFVGPSEALTVGPDADARLRALNEKLYPDSVPVVDWICDGMADCIAIS